MRIPLIGPEPVALSVAVNKKAWGSIPTRAKAVRLFSLPVKTVLLWWFRVVRSLLSHLPGWLFPSTESSMVGAYVKPYLSVSHRKRVVSLDRFFP
jgi:hypothetical protein